MSKADCPEQRAREKITSRVWSVVLGRGERLSRDDVEDLIQEVHIKAWKEREANPDRLLSTAWFRTVINNELNTMHRRRQVRQDARLFVKEDLYNDGVVYDAASQDVSKERIWDNVGTLIEEHVGWRAWVCLHLTYVMGYRQREVAELLDVSEPTVSRELSEARGLLSRLGDGEIEYDRVLHADLEELRRAQEAPARSRSSSNHQEDR